MRQNLERIMMDTLKNIIVTAVTVVIILSSLFTIRLISTSSKFKNDVTLPLFYSVFAAGLVQGIMGIVDSIICWNSMEQDSNIVSCCFFLLMVSAVVDYVSLAVLSAVKLLAVVKPFTFKRIVTSAKTTTASVGIWLISIVTYLPVIIDSIAIFSPITKTPKYGKTHNYTLISVYISLIIFYTSIISLMLTNICMYIIAVRQAILIRTSVVPQGQGSDQTRSVIASLWSAKGVIVLSAVRIAIHLPFFIMLKSNLRETPEAFYAQWALIAGPFWDALCFVGCSPTLRKQAWKMIRCQSHGVSSESENDSNVTN